MKPTRLLAFVFAALLAACATPPEAPLRVKILAINDFHGNLKTPSGGIRIADPADRTKTVVVPAGGAEHLASAVAELKARNPNHVFVAAGDLVGASPLLSSLFHDEPTVESLSAMGLEASAVGNHEFDQGAAELLRLQRGGCAADGCKGPNGRFDGARWQYLAASTVDLKSGSTLFPAVYVKRFEGVPVAFIGLTLKATPSIVVPTGVAGLEFRDEAETVNALVPGLKAQGIEAIVPEIFGAKAGAVFAEIDSVLILACGTSYYSGATARYWLESIARIPCAVEVASEYRYRDSIANARTLVVTISQSGETADTLAALRHARALGHRHTLTICNVATSAMVRECELASITRAGVEIGVASTKAFTTQLTALFLLTLTLARLRAHLDATQESAHLRSLRHLPVALGSVLALEPQIIAWAERFARHENALFLGRGPHYPIALEGALKLKEISYIHAEAYPAGELKHGPLALVTAAMPVVVVAPNDALIEKLKSNLQEVRARGGELFVFADADSKITASDGVHVIRLPEHYGVLSPILHVVPLQLLAYHTATARGTDVDKPRNLAKSVTVE